MINQGMYSTTGSIIMLRISVSKKIAQLQQISVQSVYEVIYFYIPHSSVAGNNITDLQN
jgi:hypothetical protein